MTQTKRLLREAELVLAILFALALIISPFVIQPGKTSDSLTGYATGPETETETLTINKEFVEYSFLNETINQATSIKITGTYKGNQTAKIYAKTKYGRLLIYSTTQNEKETSENSITGFVTFEQTHDDYTETDNTQIEENIQSEEPPSKEETQNINKTGEIGNLEEINQEQEQENALIEENAENEINAETLTENKTENISDKLSENGSLENTDSKNTSFENASSEKPDITENILENLTENITENTKEIEFNITNSTIITDNETEITEENRTYPSESPQTIEFDDKCMETCNILPSDIEYFEIEIESGTLFIKNIMFTSKKEAGISQLKKFEDILLEKNKTAKINLSEYFSGSPFYDATSSQGYKYSIENGIITITPEEYGNWPMQIYAVENLNVLKSNEFKIQIVQDQNFSETVQLEAEIGKPVNWIKKISSTEKITLIKLPIQASDIIIKDLNKNVAVTFQEIQNGNSEDKEKILSVETDSNYIEAAYRTPAPESRTVVLEDNPFKIKKEITIISEIKYADVKAYADLETELPEKKQITLQEYEHPEKQEYEIKDTDSNGLYDRIEWTITELEKKIYFVTQDLKSEEINITLNLSEIPFKIDEKLLDLLEENPEKEIRAIIKYKEQEDTKEKKREQNPEKDKNYKSINEYLSEIKEKAEKEYDPAEKELLESELEDKKNILEEYKEKENLNQPEPNPEINRNKLQEEINELASRIEKAESKQLAITSEFPEIKQSSSESEAAAISIKHVMLLKENLEIDAIYYDHPVELLLTDSENITKTSDAKSSYYNLTNSELDGEGARICVLDTGINSKIVRNVVAGFNVIENSTDYNDTNGHGTKIGYAIYKISPGSDIITVKAINDQGTGYESDILAGLDYCAEQNVSTISLSIGAGSSEGYCDDNPVAQKVNELSDAGILVIAAAGNDGSGSVKVPACARNALAVGASTKSDERASFSSFNNATLLLAPGENIITRDINGDETLLSGTSMSAPIVSAVSALTMQGFSNFSSMNSSEKKYYLIHTGDLINNSGKLFSRINAYNALTGNITNNLSESENLSIVNATVYYTLATECYQETATTSTACGGLNTGSYEFSGTWYEEGGNTVDGDWETGDYGYQYGAVEINYSKPTGAVSSSLFVTDMGELSITAGCWNRNPLQFKLDSWDNGGGDYGRIAYCYNGTEWIIIGDHSGQYLIVYDEAMRWYIDSVNLVNYSNFNGSTTNFSALNSSQISNLSNVTLEVTGKGKIVWNNPVNATLQDFDKNINISNNRIYVNSSGLHSSFNTSANLTIYNILFENIRILRDGSVCTTCTVLNRAGSNVTFNVTGFSNYSIEGYYLPNVSNVVLNSTTGSNHTLENLTVYFIANDSDNQSVYNTTDWRLNGASIALLNLPFNVNVSSNSTGAVRDYSTWNNNGTLGNGNQSKSPRWTTSGINGGAYAFDGVNDCIIVNDSDILDGMGKFSVSVWYNMTSSDANEHYMIGKHHVTPELRTWIIGVFSNTAPTFGIASGGNSIEYFHSNISPSLNTWVHLVGTYDGATVKLYVNGVVVNSSSLSGNINSNNESITIGCRNKDDNEMFFNGTLDELYVFNRTLTPEQISLMYANGLAHRPVMTQSHTETEKGDVWTVAVTASDNYNDSATVTSNQLMVVDNPPIINGLVLNATSLFNYTLDNLTLYYTASDSDNEPLYNTTDWRLNGTSIALVNMPFNKKTLSSNITDYSTYSHQGMIVSAEWTSSGKSGGAYIFNNGGGINLGNSSSLRQNSSFTVSAWFTVDNVSDPRTIVSKSGLPLSRGWDLKVESEGFGNITQFRVSQDCDNRTRVSIPNNYTADQWVHFAGAYKAGEYLKLYRNGVLINTTITGVPTSICEPNENLTIGDDHVGKIDEVLIFNRSLSDEQIYQIYLAGAGNKSDYPIVSNETNKGDRWSVSLIVTDAYTDAINISNNITIVDNAAPIISNVILNASSVNNYTSDNLTVYFAVTDPDSAALYNVTDWRRNGTSIAVLNMPFNLNTSSNATGAIRDYSTYGNNGTLGGGNTARLPTWISGKAGGAYYFDGGTDFINVPDSDSLDLTDNITISLWIYLNSYLQGYATNPINKWTGTTNANYVLYLFGNFTGNNDHGRVGVYATAGGTWKAVSALVSQANRLNTSQWYHVAWEYKASTGGQLYINGAAYGARTGSGALYNNSIALSIGEDNFNGSLDEVLIFNRSLSAQEIAVIYAQQSSGKAVTTLVSNETVIGEMWRVAVTSTDTINDSATMLSNEHTIANAIPSMVSSSILPSTAYTNDTLRGYCNATDEDITTLQYFYKWFLNGVLNSSGNSSFNNKGIQINVGNVSNASTTKGQIWILSCLASDGITNSSWMNSSQLTIQNSPPSQPNQPSITPAIAYKNTTLTSSAGLGSTDADGDPISYYYKWTNSTIELQNSVSDTFNCNTSSGCYKGVTMIVAVRGYDGTSYGSYSTDSAGVTILNARPLTPTTLTPTSGLYNNTIIVNCTGSSDIDAGDTITYSIQSNITGAFINIITGDSDGLYSWNTDAYEVNGVDLRCNASDGTGSSEYYNPSGTIDVDSLYPRLVYNGSTGSGKYGDTITFNVTWNDSRIDDCILEYYNGSTWSNTTNTTCASNIIWATTKTLTARRGMTLNWSWYANDSLGRMNRTLYYAFITQNSIPTVNSAVLSSSSGNNLTTDNLTVTFTASDPDNDPLWNVTDWRRNGQSIAVLNMPFNLNTSSNATGAIKDYSTYGNNGTKTDTLLSCSSLGQTECQGQSGCSWTNECHSKSYCQAFSTPICELEGCVWDGDNCNDPVDCSIYNSEECDGWPFFCGFGYCSGTYYSILPWISQGKVGGAYNFSSGKYVTLNNTPATNLSGNKLTIEFWLKHYGSGYCIVDKKRDTDGSYHMQKLSDNKISFRVFTSSQVDLRSPAALSQNVWYHVAGTYNGSLMKLYINGTLVNSTSQTGNINTNNYPVRIGSCDDGNELVGLIDEVRIYNISLSDSQIYSNYMNGLNNLSLILLDKDETSADENWSVAVTSTDTYNDSTTVLSNNLTILGSPGYDVCGNLTTANTIYTLSKSVSINGSTCFNVTAANVTLNCAGYSITGNNTASTYGVYSNQYNTTIKNCNIHNFSIGISLSSANNSNLQNNTITSTLATGYGINMGGSIKNVFISDSTFNSSGTAGNLQFGNNITINNSNFFSNGYSIFTTVFDNSTISNSRFIGGISWSSANYNTFIGNNATLYGGSGLTLEFANYNNITSSSFISPSLDDSGWVYLLSSSGNRIVNSVINSSFDYSYDGALFFDGSNSNIVINTTVIGRRGKGITISSSSNTQIINSTIMSTNGYAIYGTYAQYTTLDNVNITANLTSSLAGHARGILLYDSYFGIIRNSVIRASNETILYGEVIHSNIYNNTLISLSGSSNLLKIPSSAFNNTLYWNNFTATTGLYVQDLNGTNKYNATVNSLNQGNIYANVLNGSVIVSGMTASSIPGYYIGSRGPGQPYTNTTSLGKFSCNFAGCADYAPLTNTRNYIAQVSSVILNSSSGNNLTSDNLTVSFTATDSDGDALYNVTDWRRNGTSIAVLNMPFNTNVSSTVVGAVRDYSTFGNNGTLMNTPQWISNGKVGGAYDVGTSDYINITTITNLSNQSYTISLWFQIDTKPVDTYSLVYGTITTTSNERIRIEVYNNSGTYLIQATNDYEGDVTITSTQIATGTWYMATLVYDLPNNNKSFYLNGGQYSNSISGLIETSTNLGMLSIGRRTLATAYQLDGKVDELLIFNRSLSPQQVYSIYTEQSTGKAITTLSSEETELNEMWSVAVTTTDTKNDSVTVLSNNITIKNANPAVVGSRILPATAYASDTLKGYCNATDADMNNVKYHYKWFLNGALNNSGTTNLYTQGIELNVANISSSQLAIGQIWILECRADDLTVNSTALNSSSVTISGSCTNITSSNSVSTLTTNLTINNATCLNIWANNVTINCAGYSILGNNATNAYGIYSNSSNTTILNCNINWFEKGVFFNNTIDGNITNVNVSANLPATDCTTLSVGECPSVSGCYVGSDYCQYNGICESQTNEGDCNTYGCWWHDEICEIGYNMCGDQLDESGCNDYPAYCNWITGSCTGTASSCGAAGTCAAFMLRNATKIFLEKTRTTTNTAIGLYLLNSTLVNSRNSYYSGSDLIGTFLQFSSNNTFFNISANSTTFHAVYLNRSSNNTISNSTTNSNTGIGIVLYTNSNNNLINNTLGNSSNYIGIYLTEALYNNIQNSRGISYSSRGILINYANHTNIINSSGTSNLDSGIHLDNSYYNNITQSYGNSSAGSGIYMYMNSNSNTIFRSNGTSTTGHGLYMFSSSYNNITDFTGNSSTGMGIYLTTNANYNNITYSNGTSKSNFGLYFENSYNNRLINNTFIGNDEIYFSGSTMNICSNIIANNTGNMSRPILYYSNSAANVNNQISSVAILCNASGSNITNTNITGGIYLIFSNNTYLSNISSIAKTTGLYVYGVYNSKIDGMNASGNAYGSYFSQSGYNNITNLIGSTFHIQDGSYFKLDNITGISSNNYGVSVQSSNNDIRNVNGTSSTVTGFLTNGNTNIITNVTATSTSTSAYYLGGSYNNISNIKGYSVSGIGISIFGTSHRITNIVGTSDSGRGLYISSSYNLLTNINGSSNSNTNIYSGIYFAASTYNNMSNVLAISNRTAGLYLDVNSNYNNISNSTAISYAERGLHIVTGNYNTIRNSTIISNRSVAAYLITSDNNIFFNNTLISDNDTLLYLESTANFNTFYWNNFTNTSYTYLKDLAGDNKYNSTLSGSNEGNIWFNVMNRSVNISGSTNSTAFPNLAVGNSGTGYPYNKSNSNNKFNCSFASCADFAPLTPSFLYSPVIITSTILPTTAYTNDTLRGYCNATDGNLDNIYYHFRWFKNGVLNSSGTTASSYAQALNINVGNVSATLTTKNDAWILSCRADDLGSNSSWMNSTALTILNHPPDIVTLLLPSNGNDTITNKTPMFNWTATTDIDLDSITYNFQLSLTSNFASLTRNITGITSLNYTETSELDFNTYYWRVRANDGTADGPWSETWNFTIESALIINLVNDSMNFGLINMNEQKNTTSNTPSPFAFRNDGNIFADMSNISANSSIWSTQPLDTSYWMFRLRSSGTQISYNLSGSLASLQNVSNTSSKIVDKLNPANGNDTAYVDIFALVPTFEPPGIKNTTISFTWVAS